MSSHFLLFSPQSSELDDILNDLQNSQSQLFCELRPVTLPTPMDKQNIINDILQMSESNPALAAQQQHRGIAAGMGPSSKSHMYLMHKVIKLVFHFSRLQFIPRKYSQPKTKGLWRLLFFTFYLSLPTDFGNVRPSQPGRGLPVRSGSLDMNVSPQPASLQYPIRATSPYTVMQQQQQGMTGNHSMMANQAVMVNAGEGAGCSHVVSSR